jgi:hypothetical protein
MYASGWVKDSLLPFGSRGQQPVVKQGRRCGAQSASPGHGAKDRDAEKPKRQIKGNPRPIEAATAFPAGMNRSRRDGTAGPRAQCLLRVKMRNTLCEQMFSASPPKTDIRNRPDHDLP